ncbi:probable cytochrome P450 313a1 [Sitophilus oryzae]|uniref:Probable cytochrome P450 313a1 n=1 Tax=Sitophilus oryzae TaxID=7048 RepID=A0A6J2X5U5_SITOR|nr:probable cytochrome P450 313a1 [Sitophilus oryzae]
MFVSAYVFGILITLFLLLMSYFWNKRRMYRLSLKLPGPISLPVIGNGLQLLCSPEDMYDHSLGIFRRYPSPMSFWFGPKFSIIFKDATQVEVAIRLGQEN